MRKFKVEKTADDGEIIATNTHIMPYMDGIAQLLADERVTQVTVWFVEGYDDWELEEE